LSIWSSLVVPAADLVVAVAAVAPVDTARQLAFL
jgi:hypothetical protein